MRVTEHGLDTVVLRAGAAEAALVPSRGGLVTRFRVGDDERLALDVPSLVDPAKNVRGGIPILFPFPGKPPSGSSLKQHGFARTLAWKLDEERTDRAVCVLAADASTRATFPHDFKL